VLRRLLPLLALAALAVPSAAQASAGSVFPDVRFGNGFALRMATSDFWGRTDGYPVPSGYKVHVLTSDGSGETPLAADQENQDLADFLDTALHGPEIQTVKIYRVSPIEITQDCGSADALSCYSPMEGVIITSADPVIGGFSAHAALLHEYGHHIANSRRNTPSRAIDTGPKHWASYENVCAEAKRGNVFPGAEDSAHYELNPGEGWAESYRVLNEQRLGLPQEGLVVDNRFYPTARALQLIQQDVLDPWKQPPASTLSGRLAAGRTHTYRVATPLDGNFAVRGPSGLKLAVLGPSKKLKAGNRSVNTQVCGQRTLRIRVTANRTESYKLKVTKP
jgi:hypothetical protein